MKKLIGSCILLLLALFTLTKNFALNGLAHAETKISSERKHLKIGVILPLSGPFARYGFDIQKALIGFKSDTVTLVFEDEGCDPKQAVSAFKKLSAVDDVNLFLGPWCGSSQSAIVPLLKSSDSLTVLGSSASEALFQLSDDRIFSSQQSIESESTYLAERMNQFGVKRVVVVFRENQFSRAHEAAFRNHFSGEILETMAYSSGDTAELRAIALRIRQRNPDALYVPDASPFFSGLMKELRVAGVKNTKIFSVYSVQSQDLLKIMGEDGEGLLYAYPDIQEEASSYFPKLAAHVLIEAASSCGRDVSCVRKNLRDSKRFNKNGILEGKSTLKTIRRRRFERL